MSFLRNAFKDALDKGWDGVLVSGAAASLFLAGMGAIGGSSGGIGVGTGAEGAVNGALLVGTSTAIGVASWFSLAVLSEKGIEKLAEKYGPSHEELYNSNKPLPFVKQAIDALNFFKEKAAAVIATGGFFGPALAVPAVMDYGLTKGFAIAAAGTAAPTVAMAAISATMYGAHKAIQKFSQA